MILIPVPYLRFVLYPFAFVYLMLQMLAQIEHYILHHAQIFGFIW